MRYTKLFLLAALSALTFSCNKEMESNQPAAVDGITEITATLADGQTKTVLGSDGTSILWSPNDEISVFYNEIGLKFTALNSKPTACTVFASDKALVYGRTENESSPFLYAAYPYSSSNEQEGDLITLTVPASQTAVEGNFVRGAYPSVGRSKNTDIAFYNVCGGLRFSVTHSGVKKVVFSGLKGESLAGRVALSFSADGKPIVNSVISGEDEVILNALDGETLVPGTFYYISLLPSALASGFRMVFYTTTKHATLEKTSSVDIKRSVFGSLSNADNGLEYVKGGAGGRVFTARFADGTKTSRDDYGSLIWDDGQTVFLTDREDSEIPAIVKKSDKEGTLTCDTLEEDMVYGGVPSNYYVYNSGMLCKVPSVQDGSFNEACIAVAKSDANDYLEFSPINSLVEMSFDEAVDSVRLRDLNGCMITGNSAVNLSGSPYLETPSFGSSSVSARPKYKSKVFYSGVVPCSVLVCLDIYNNGKVAHTSFSSVITLQKGHIVKFPKISLSSLDFKTDLGIKGTANCYLVSQPGTYTFNASVKGGSTESVGTPASAEVLWESFGTDVTPAKGDIINNSVSLENGYVKFSTPSTLNNGNAVIAVKDASNNILWSWHIWVCKDFDPKASAHVYNNNAGTMMDRNLGATSATPGDVHTLGLFYQWGRKDPFLGGDKISYGSSSNQQAASTLSWPSTVPSDASNGTIAYAVAHPTTLITSNSSNEDWYYTGSSSTDDTRWQTSDKAKGMYDPCPQGWRIPDGGDSGVWSKAFGSSSYFSSGPWDSHNYGMNFGSGNGKPSSMQLGSSTTIWYPAAGFLFYENGSLHNVGSDGYYWSCTPNDNGVEDMDFSDSGSVDQGYNFRAFAQSVRCISE